MKRKLLFPILLLMLGVFLSSALNAQVNMSRYITLTVKSGADIKIRLSADADNTPVKIVSGSLDTTIAVSAAWQKDTITAAASTMTFYGNIQQFGCDRNGGNITGLDVTQNTKLKDLTCYGNHLGNLDVSKNTELTTLFCYRNQLSTLDVSKNTELTTLLCSENQLSTLRCKQKYGADKALL